MNETQARTLIEARSGYTQTISRKTANVLRIMFREDQAERGMQTLFGGPVTKQELISALVELHYPLTKLNEATHVLYHSAEFPNEACPWCDPHPCPQCGAIDTCTYTVGGSSVINGRHSA